MVKVSNCSYTEFARKYKHVEIPSYQRPYSWKVESVEALLEDLKEHFLKEKDATADYYIGSVLLHHKDGDETYEVIDGQQRLTTLHLMHHVLGHALQSGQDFTYNSQLSFRTIHRNTKLLRSNIDLLKELEEKRFMERVVFTVIVSDNEDNAFSFFDSQNNRGVSLGADDYLKAYHLREVLSEPLQEKLAEQWETAAIKAQSHENRELGLLHLFYNVLFRAREWRGQTSFHPPGKDAVLRTFQKKTVRDGQSRYRLYSGRFNQRFEAVNVTDEGEMIFEPVDNSGGNDLELPFTLRQPLFKGHNFFWFTRKYHEVLHMLLFSKDAHSEEVEETRKYYQAVYDRDMSEYLRHYMQLCLVMYYDSFGEEKLSEAIKHFDYFMGGIRLSKYYVRQEAIKNSLMHGVSNNLLDVIATAYTPEEVFDFIKSQEGVKETYRKIDLSNDRSLVKKRYVRRVIKANGRESENIKNRWEWIG